jgi:type II secretory pathway pseudopilin PulG
VTARRGFALVAALLALVLIAALVASVLFAAAEETRIGSASAAGELALTAAESAIEVTLANWDAGAGIPVGIGGAQSTSIDWFRTPVRVTVTRLDSTLYWVVADAGAASSQGSPARRIGAFVRVEVMPDRSIKVDRIPERWWSEVF